MLVLYRSVPKQQDLQLLRLVETYQIGYHRRHMKVQKRYHDHQGVYHTPMGQQYGTQIWNSSQCFVEEWLDISQDEPYQIEIDVW